jgi:hypothetical protein
MASNIICDWLYQSNVLHRFIVETQGHVDPYHLAEHYGEVTEYFNNNLNRMVAEKFGSRYKGAEIVIENLRFNWDGVFYIYFDVKLEGIQFKL